MSPQNVNLQDSFLNQARKEAAPVEIMLLNGAQFNGIIRGFDSFTVVLETAAGAHLIYKHAIAHFMTERLKMRASPAEGGADKPSAASARKSAPTEKKDAERKTVFNPLDLSGVSLDDPASK